MTMNPRYSDVLRIPSFEERFELLKLTGAVGVETFGSSRYLNQEFYSSQEWRSFRDDIIVRDNGCDLAVPGREMEKYIVVHHIIPITEYDIVHGTPLLFDPENVICVSPITHKAIHYGDKNQLYPDPVERYPNDTCTWKGGRL